MRSIVELRVSLQSRTLQSLTLGGRRIVVGRSPNGTVCIDNVGISWEHFRIRLHDDGQYSVRDLDSANGTFVNGQRVRTTQLHDGDVIRVGKFSLHVGLREAGAHEEIDDEQELTHRVLLPTENTTTLSVRDLRKMLARATGRFRAVDPNETNISSESEMLAHSAHPPGVSAPSSRPYAQAQTVYEKGGEPSWIMVGWALIIGLVLGVILTRLAFG